MAKVSRGHTIAAGITLVAVLLMAGGAGAVKEINSCTDITSPDTYVLRADIVDSGASRCINISSSNVILDGAGHTIDGTGAEDTYGVFVSSQTGGTDLTNVNVKNLRITDWDYGIVYRGILEMVNGSITDNFISAHHFGIILDQANNHVLTNNSMNSGRINLFYSKSNKITNNNVGITLFHSHGNTITGNNASGRGGINLIYAADNIVTSNDVSSNKYGIDMGYYASDNILANNKITGSDIGIYLGTAAEGNTITDNNISSNGYGIYLATSSNNTIYNNYFNNTNNARDDGNNIWNIRKTVGTNIIGGSWLGGNYWSDYAGEDVNGDGLGETSIPYNSGGNITNGGDELPIVRTGMFYGITGTGFNDMNRNGVRDAGEEGLENRVVQLKGTDKHTGRIIKRTATTDTSGNYVFADLKPGFYILSEEQERGWMPTTSPVRSVRLGENQNTVVDFGNKRMK